jgi:dUTP pyrophosphatase
MIVKFKKLHPNAVIPTKSHDDDFCYDCTAVSEEQLAPNVWRYKLGFSLQIERDDTLDKMRDEIKLSIDGRPRSSIWKTGMVLANSTATIDEGYTGEIMAVFYHVIPEMPRYKIGDKVLQITIGVSEPIEFTEVNELDETSRGSGGFGSTGK